MNSTSINTISGYMSVVMKTSTIISVVLGPMLIWKYLSAIGRNDVFPSVVQSGGVFFIVVIFFSMIFFSLMFTFVIPSVILNQLLVSFVPYRDVYAVVNPVFVPVLSMFVAFLSISSIVLLAYFNVTSTNLINFGMMMLFSIISSGLMFVFSRKKIRVFLDNTKITTTSNLIIRKIVIGVISAISGYFALLPMSFLYLYSINYIETIEGYSVFFGMLLLITFLSLFPAFVSFNSRVKKNINGVTMISGYLFTVIVLFFAIPNISMIMITGTLNATGMLVEKKTTYIIPSKNYPDDFFKKDVWGEDLVKKENGFYFVEATSAFSLGNIILLCPSSGKYDFFKDLNKYKRDGYDSFFNKKNKELNSVMTSAKKCIAIHDVLTHRFNDLQVNLKK